MQRGTFITIHTQVPCGLTPLNIKTKVMNFGETARLPVFHGFIPALNQEGYGVGHSRLDGNVDG